MPIEEAVTDPHALGDKIAIAVLVLSAAYLLVRSIRRFRAAR
jgi:hypothetical protein